MKVLLISAVVPGDAMPGTARTVWLFEGLASAGLEVHLLALRRPRVMRAKGAGPIPTDSVTIVPDTCRERAGVLASVFSRDGGLRRGLVSHPSLLLSVRRGLEVVEHFGPDVILSTAPPAFITEAAYQISAESGVHWVSDLRDPVSLAFLNIWPNRSYYEALAEREREWFEHAEVNVVTAPSYARVIRSAFPDVRVEVITNGWAPVPDPREEKAAPGTLLYSGSSGGNGYGFVGKFPAKLSRRIRRSLTFGRRCYAPFAAEVAYQPYGIAALRAIAAAGDRVSALLFQGRLSADVSGHLRRMKLRAKVRELPWVSPDEALGTMRGAHVLWLSLCGQTRTEGEPIVASKVFKYLASGRPIFAALPPECDTAEILRGHRGVFMPDPGDDRAMDEALAEALSLSPEKRFERDVREYRRDRLAGRMVNVLHRL